MARYKDRIDTRFNQQESKGIAKYGQPLEQNHGRFDYRLEHLAQELTDGLMYVEWLKESGKVITTMFELLVQDMEAKQFCPLETPCSPENIREGGCVGCLMMYYEEKAREQIL